MQPAAALRRRACALRRPQGFTLIELMIVVVIVGILAAIAYPSYLEQVRKTRRAECTGVLLQNANAMERHFTLNNSYAGAPAPVQCPADGGRQSYVVTSEVTASTWALRATPDGPQEGDRCGTLTLTHTGIRGIENASPGRDWQDCW